MENETKQARRTADQILFAEHEKFEQKKRALRKIEKLLNSFDTLKTEILDARDELEALGMNRTEIIKAFEVDTVTAKVLKSSSEKTEQPATPSATETSSTPAEQNSTEDDTTSDKTAQNW